MPAASLSSQCVVLRANREIDFVKTRSIVFSLARPASFEIRAGHPLCQRCRNRQKLRCIHNQVGSQSMFGSIGSDFPAIPLGHYLLKIPWHRRRRVHVWGLDCCRLNDSNVHGVWCVDLPRLYITPGPIKVKLIEGSLPSSFLLLKEPGREAVAVLTTIFSRKRSPP